MANSSSPACSPPNSPAHKRAPLSALFVDIVAEYFQRKSANANSFSLQGDESIMDSLRQLPLFQALQVIHRFFDSIGPRIVNQQTFLFSIIRSTNRWWSPIDGSKIYMDGPNTSLIVELCMNNTLNPDVFTPSVCHVLQLLPREQIVSIAQSFGTHTLALAFSGDSYYAKQQLFLSMAQAALMKFEAQASLDDTELHASELSAMEAAELGRIRLELSAQSQLPGILSEFIARTCATSKGFLRESDFDNKARDALKRVALLQAMQAVQHFSYRLIHTPQQINNRSAFLMGILQAQVIYWGKSRAAFETKGGAATILQLPPRLLLKIAHLCLDEHCFPSDFSPEVCAALRQSPDFDTAVKAILAFNNNRRIAAGSAGGVINRESFFLHLVQNINAQHYQQHPHQQERIGKLKPAVGKLGGMELNPKAKPYSPQQFVASSPVLLTPLSPSLPPLVTPPPPPMMTVVSATTTTTTSSAAPPTAPPPPKTSDSSIDSMAAAHESRLLESSRDAIAYLTSSFARSRTAEIRLRRELAESQAQVMSLMQNIQKLKEDHLRSIEDARAQILVNVQRKFDSLVQSSLEPPRLQKNLDGENNGAN